MASSLDGDLPSAEHLSISESGTTTYAMEFHEKFIADLSDYYVTMANKWESVARILLLSDYASGLKAEWATTQKLHSVVLKWLNDSHGPRSQDEAWKKLIEVLNSTTVDLTELAKTIREERPLALTQSSKEDLLGSGGLTINCESSSKPGSAPSQPQGFLQSCLSSHSRITSSISSDQLTERTKYRFAIIVANDNELHATMHFLGSTLRWPKVTEDAVKKCTYEGDENLKNKIKTEDSFNTEGKYRLKFYPITVCKIPGVVVKCGSMGSFSHMGSHRTTLQLMKEATGRGWKLKTIFIVGCCGTRPEIEQGTCPEIEENEQGTRPEIEENEQGVSESPSPENAKRIVSNSAVPHAKSNGVVPIGTVLVAKEIFQYAMGKLKDGAIEWTPLCCSTPQLFVDLDAVQYGDEGSDACRIVKKVQVATFLSGDFVIKGRDTALELAELYKNQKYVGFEMEGVGAKKATSDAEIFVPDLKMPKVVLVKGVSDKAGGDKNKPCAIQFFPEKPILNVKEDSRQQMCTISSLTLVLRYIIQFKTKFTN